MRFARMLVAGTIFLAPAMFGTVTYLSSGVFLGTGDPFSAEADFTISNGMIKITLTNLSPNPKDIDQNINGVSFALPGTFSTNVGTVSSFSADDRFNITRYAPGGWTDSVDTTNHWFFTNVANNFNLSTVGNPGTQWTIIGGSNSSGQYTNVDASLQGLNVHNNYYAQTATWIFNVPGAVPVDESSLSNVAFSFGLGPNYQMGFDPSGVTPEPISLVLTASGLLLLLLSRKFKLARSREVS